MPAIQIIPLTRLNMGNNAKCPPEADQPLTDKSQNIK